MATLSDSLRPRCGIVTHRSIGPSTIGPRLGKPRRLVAHHERDPAGEIARGVRHDVATGGVVAARADEEQAGRRDVVEFGDDDRDVEDRTGRRPDDLRAVRVDRTWREHHEVDAGGLRRANDRAEVAGVADAVEDDARTTPIRALRSTSVAAHPHDGDRRLRGLRRRDAFEHAGGELEDRARMSRRRVAALRHELRLDAPPGAHASATSVGPSTTKRPSS